MHPSFRVLIPLSFAVAACGGDTTAPGTSNNPGTPPATIRNVAGSYSRIVSIGGVTREYIVYVGTTVGATTAAPVVFMFHGSGQSGPQFYNISKWKEKADEHGLIAVFPSALTYCNKEDLNNDGDMTDAGEMTVETKWSSGRLNTAERPLCSAAERSGVFASLHMHGGAAEIVSTAARSISVTGSLGNVDKHVQDAYGITALPMTQDMFTRYPGVKVKYVLPMLSMLQLQDVSTYQQLTINGKLVSQWTWRTSAVGAGNSFVFSLVGDNDHSYPNGVLHPIVIAEPLWQFFSALQLP
ncbi:MAG: hypothetical protein U0164_20740 [Gemmatimonadaceae bacterium]